MPARGRARPHARGRRRDGLGSRLRGVGGLPALLMPERPFEGKVALITGSSRGIGRAIAVRLARGGADVIVNYRTREEEARVTAAAVEEAGSRATVVRANMGDPADIEVLFAAGRGRPRRPDLLVCHAAAGPQGAMP